MLRLLGHPPLWLLLVVGLGHAGHMGLLGSDHKGRHKDADTDGQFDPWRLTVSVCTQFCLDVPLL